MRQIALGGFSVAASLLLVSCAMGPQVYNAYWKTGAPPSRQRDFMDCEVTALMVAPRALTTTTTPTYTTPANIQCNTFGNYTSCTDTGSRTFGGHQITSDLNADLRGRVLHQCLIERGYALLTFPACTKEQLASGRLASLATDVQPQPLDVICLTESGYIRR